MMRKKEKRAARAAAPDSDDEGGATARGGGALRAWDSGDEGSSDAAGATAPGAAADARRAWWMKKEASAAPRARVVAAAPIKRVLLTKRRGSDAAGEGRRAFAVVVDLGDGLEGLVPLEELAEDTELRGALAAQLGSLRPPPPPAALGDPDRRPRLRVLRVAADPAAGCRDAQLRLTGRFRAVAECVDEAWAALPDGVRDFLARLHDRDRVAALGRLRGAAVGGVMHGVVERRAAEGLVLSLAPPPQEGPRERAWWPDPPPRAAVGVAVGANALLPGQEAAAAADPGTPGATPAGTPASLPSDAGAAPPAGAVRCRVLDVDAAAGCCDVSCAPAVAAAQAASRRVATQVAKTLRKLVGSTVKCQVVLRKARHAVVVSRQHAGALGYLVLDPARAARADYLRVGERLQARVEYVRVRPPPPPRPRRKRWEQMGRAFQPDDDDGSGGGEAEPDAAARAAARAREEEQPPADAWLLPEPFAVLTPIVDPPPAAPAPPAPAAPAANGAAAPTTAQSPTAAAAVGRSPTAAAAKRGREEINVGFGFGFGADATPGPGPAAAGDGGGGGAAAAKRKRRKGGNEVMVDEAERARVDDSAVPKSVEDFERLAMASPGSSYVWCQYMAFHMAAREFEKSRLVAERALTTIPVTDSQEHHNVWVAYLNLENIHGTQESLNGVFRRFEQRSDDKLKAHMALVDIGKASGHNALVHRAFQTVLRKFGFATIEPWVGYARFLIERGNQDEVNRLQKRMLAGGDGGLPEKHRVQALLKIGCVQFRDGSVDRGRTVFEGLIVKYPKRTDIWSVYLDMEQVVLPRLGDPARIRSVFDRVTSLNMSSKKMQYFLTRYAGFEREHGDEARQRYVKERAVAFVNQKLGGGGGGDDDA